jgi:hypothetical protein
MSAVDQDWLTWSAFVGRVKTLMPLVKNRLGLQDDEDGNPGYITSQIRLAVLDLQEYIAAYRTAHETIYYPSDFVTEGSASVAVLPPQAILRELWFYDNDRGVRYGMAREDWLARFKLVNQVTNLYDNQGRYAFDPAGYKFMVYPRAVGNLLVSVQWDGKKEDFNDDELTPFTSEAAQAVSDWVKAKVAREFEKDMKSFESYWADYLIKRRQLYISERERIWMRSSFTNPGAAEVCYPETNAVSSGGSQEDQSTGGGGGGGTTIINQSVQEVFRYDGDPEGVIVPEVDQAVCIDPTNNIVWQWYDGTWHH